MSGIPVRDSLCDNRVVYIEDVLLDCHSSEPSATFGLADLPARVRGERFDQQSVVTYSFRGHAICANLLPCHPERAIVVQTDISRNEMIVELPQLSKQKMDFATKLLNELGRKHVGRMARLAALVCGRQMSTQIEGPFVPYQPGVAFMVLVIRVSRDKNFDIVYEQTQRFLELHQENDDRARFLQSWLPQPQPSPAANEQPVYDWTSAELAAAERMAPTELDEEDPWSSLGAREFKPSRPRPTDAATAASNLLGHLFSGGS